MKINVLYEDNHLIAVFKPAGVLTQGDRGRNLNLLDEVKKYLKEKYKKPGNVFLGLLHRLDRPVSGIVLFAKTSKGASRLSEQFRSHTIGKIYHGVVIGRPKKDKGELIDYILKKESKKKAVVFRKNIGGAKEARLYYEVLASDGNFSLIKIKIKTGKFHQIRAQLSSIGCPVAGDVKYGAPSALSDKSICLSATSLSFFKATTNEIKEISAPIPDEWKKYISF